MKRCSFNHCAASKHNADLVKKKKGSAESGPRSKMDRCCLDGGKKEASA